MQRPDPDRLAIIRQRRQQGRCVACGVAAGRAAICGVCRDANWFYCPCCESAYQRPRQPSDEPTGRTSRRCSACIGKAERGARRRAAKRADYLVAVKAHRHPALDAIIRHYQAGRTYRQIADVLLMPVGTLNSIVVHAKKKKQWPRGLRRTRGRRTDLAQKANAQ